LERLTSISRNNAGHATNGDNHVNGNNHVNGTQGNGVQEPAAFVEDLIDL
jgi:hypothetical protein